MEMNEGSERRKGMRGGESGARESGKDKEGSGDD